MPADRQLPLFPADNGPHPRAEASPELSSESPLVAAIAPFLQHSADRELAENTLRALEHDLGLLLAYVQPETPLAACSTEQLRAFVRYLRYERHAPCSDKSLRRRIATLKAFFSWLAENGVLPQDPAAPLTPPEAASPLPQPLSDAEVERLLEATRRMWMASEKPDPRPHLLVTLVLATGLKKGECMGIALRDLDLADPTHPSVLVRYQRRRQRHKQRRLSLPQGFVEALAAYRLRYQPRERLFECTARNLEYVLRDTSLAAGLSHTVSFEMLRWTCAVRDYRSGMPEQRLRRKLGLSMVAWRETLPVLKALAAEPL